MGNKSIALMAALLLAACGAENVDVRADGGAGPSLPGLDGSLGDGVQDMPADMPQESTTPELLTNGLACREAAECKSAFCVDGVCCAGKCDGLCLSCAQPGTAGTCAPHPPGTDPDNECADDGVASCAKDGLCDGSGACRVYPASTVCSAAACAASTLTPAGTCDSAGICQKPAAVSCGKFACATPPSCRTACVTTADCRAPNICAAGACGGLMGQYYNTPDLTGAIVLTRTDPDIDFDWLAGSPGPGVLMDLFSVRWTGTLTPRFTETYTFYIGATDGDRLFIGTTMVINNFIDKIAIPEDMGTMALTAGTAYPIRVEYYERFNNASIRLSWSSPSQPKVVIPTSAFSPP